MNDQMKAILAGFVRHALTTAGGALVTGGVLQSSQVTDFVGAGMILAGVAWSWYEKKGQAEINAAFKTLTSNVKKSGQ